VVVATDDLRIAEHVLAFGGEVVMTSENCLNGTERCAETLAFLQKNGSDYDLIVNIQGDEPFIRPEQIDAISAVLAENDHFHIATLIKKIETQADLFNQNIVKAVVDKTGRAMYFSRQAVPFLRGKEPSEWLQAEQLFYKHIGMYAYRADYLHRLAHLSATPLELAESLEQLRWLEHGFNIGTATTYFETIGIDTPEDLLKIK
jgi:3-deoxy-manno-octulosonate cytidylyltransferase (CMP-KDO synthetase)